MKLDAVYWEGYFYAILRESGYLTSGEADELATRIAEKVIQVIEEAELLAKR